MPDNAVDMKEVGSPRKGIPSGRPIRYALYGSAAASAMVTAIVWLFDQRLSNLLRMPIAQCLEAPILMLQHIHGCPPGPSLYQGEGREGWGDFLGADQEAFDKSGVDFLLSWNSSVLLFDQIETKIPEGMEMLPLVFLPLDRIQPFS
jgi:hypothetical protein